MANSRGMTLPSALIRPTAPPEPESAPVDDQGDGEAVGIEGQGRGAEPGPTPSSGRRKGASAKEKTAKTPTAKRGVYLTDAVWERLQLEAIRKRSNVSKVAGDLLERNLPRLRIERDA